MDEYKVGDIIKIRFADIDGNVECTHWGIVRKIYKDGSLIWRFKENEKNSPNTDTNSVNLV